VKCSATDAAGNKGEASFTVIVQDKTKPVIAPQADITATATTGDGAVVNFTLTATDIVDGTVPVICSSTSGSTFLGETTVNCTATDKAGNKAESSFKVNVTYRWAGFFQPINNTALNTVKAGSAIPVKFSLGGNMGMNVIASGYPRAVASGCSGAGEDPIADSETLGNVSSNSFNYDASADQYVYVWKSDKGWTGRCVQLQLMMRDGTTHYANFGFTK
jgi:hypothetical protein